MLPKDLVYYKPIKISKNKNYYIVQYIYKFCDKHRDIMIKLLTDFDILFGEFWLYNFVLNICLSYA